MKTWIFVVFVCMILIFINELINITKSYLLIHYYKDVADINLNKNCNDIYCEAETGRFKLSNNVYDIILPTDINNMQIYYYILVFLMVFLFIGYYAKLIKTYEKINVFFNKYEISSSLPSRWLFAVTYFLLLIIVIICITLLLVRRYAPTDKKGYLQLFYLNYNNFIKNKKIKETGDNIVSHPDDIGIGNIQVIFIGSIIALFVTFITLCLCYIPNLSNEESVKEFSDYTKDNNQYRSYKLRYIFIFIFLAIIFVLIFICSTYLLADKNYNNPSQHIAVSSEYKDDTTKPTAFYNQKKEDFTINDESGADGIDYDKYSFNAGSTYNSIDTFYDKYYYDNFKYNFLDSNDLNIYIIFFITIGLLSVFMLFTYFIYRYNKNKEGSEFCNPIIIFLPACVVIILFILYIYIFTDFNKNYNKNYIYGAYNSIYNNYLLRLNNIVVPYIHLHESIESNKENTNYLENYIITNVFASIITNNLPIYNGNTPEMTKQQIEVDASSYMNQPPDNLANLTGYTIIDTADHAINDDNIHNLDYFTEHYNELFGTEQINLDKIFDKTFAELTKEPKLEFLATKKLSDYDGTTAPNKATDTTAKTIATIEDYIKKNRIHNNANSNDALTINTKYLVTIIKYFRDKLKDTGKKTFNLSDFSYFDTKKASIKLYVKDKNNLQKFIIKSSVIINHLNEDFASYVYDQAKDKDLADIVENFLINLEYMKYNFNEYITILSKDNIDAKNSVGGIDHQLYVAKIDTSAAKKQFRNVLLNEFRRRIIRGFSLYQNTEYTKLEESITDTYKYLIEPNYKEDLIYKNIEIDKKYTTLKYLHANILNIKNQSGNEIANSQLSEIIKANYKNIYNDNAKLNLGEKNYKAWQCDDKYKYLYNFNGTNIKKLDKIQEIKNNAIDTINTELIAKYCGNIVLLASVFIIGHWENYIRF